MHYNGSYRINLMEVDLEYCVALIDELICAGFAAEEMIAKQEAYCAGLAENQKAWDAHITGLRSAANG